MKKNKKLVLSLCAIMIAYFVLLLVASAHEENAKAAECDKAGGVWLPKNSQCVVK